jgi:hypothetical protein
VLLLIYGLVKVVYLAMSGAHFSILAFVFVYFYLRGAIQIFQNHREARRPVSSARSV